MRRAAVAVFLAALVFSLYRKVTRLWWTYDDAWTLRLVVDNPLVDSFIDPSMWPQKLFTPLVTTAFEAQLAAFGLEPSRWYVVHLVLLFAAALALYATLRLWLSPAASFTGAALFIAGVPTCAVIAVLGGTHYLQAIALGCLSVIAYVKAGGGPSPRVRGEGARRADEGPRHGDEAAALTRRFAPPSPRRAGRGATALLWLSAALYLVAMLAKETAVPLVVLLWFLPERKGRLAPHALALLIYLAWRYAVIDTILGGYGWAIAPDEWPRLLLSLPQKIVLACAGAGVEVGIAMLIVTAIGVAVAMRRNALLVVVALALAVGPIVPVSKEMQRRYALMPWLVWSIAFVAGADRMKRGKAALFATAGAIAIVANRQEWAQEFGRIQRMSDEAHFFFYMPPDGILRNPKVPPAAMGELVWLQSHAGRPTGASWFLDDYFLCTDRTSGKRIWEYVKAKRGVVEIPAPPCPAYRRDVRLTWQFRYRDGSLFWKLGPYERGQYRVLLDDGVQAFDVPREAAFRLPEVPGMTVRLRYESPEGWSTVSPPIELRFQ